MPHFITSDNCSLYFETYGFAKVKPTVVFLNGTTQSALQWRPQALQFRDDFRVVLYDGRGQGKSDLGKIPLSGELHARDLRDLMGHLKIGAANLVGLSHGAHVALVLAALHPDCVERMVLCSLGAAMSATTRTVVRSWLEVLRRGGPESMAWAAVPVVLGDRFLGQHEKILDKIIAAVAMRNRRDALEAHLKALAEYPPPAEYAGRHQHPALVVSGSQDTLVAPRSAALLAELCRGRWSPVEGAGHTVPVEDPETFNRRVKAFFFRHPSTDRP